MRFDDEQIIAFLLGDLSEEVAEQILHQIARDGELAARVEQYRQLLGLLDESSEVFEPPAGLVDRTMARLADAAVDLADAATADEVPVEPPLVYASAAKVQPASLLSAGSEASRSRRQFWDSTVLTLSLSILCCLALPALVRVRFESRKAQCASNLRQTGMGFFDYAMQHPDNRFPQIPATGPASFAGVYPLQLRDHGLLSSIAQLLCPSVDPRVLAAQTDVELLDLQGMQITDLPTVAKLGSFTSGELTAWKVSAGGNYAYGLGISDDGVLRSPRCEGQTHLAILADAPVFYDGLEAFIAHDGRGTNMLYADGHVHFVQLPRSWSRSGARTLEWQYPTDDPFRNVAGEHRAGLHSNDASLAPSPIGP